MVDETWIDARAACALLGVRPQTLYAYVGRHGVRVMADPNTPRRSLYAQADLDALSRRNRRPRARAQVAEAAIRWGDPVLSTSISEVRDGTVWLRGRAIDDCAETMTLEEVAAHLCAWDRIEASAPMMQASGASSFSRAMRMLAGEADGAPSLVTCGPDDGRDVGRLLSLTADACLGAAHSGPIHARVAAHWGLDAAGSDLARRALVLLSEHELNPSTFAVRVCASTGASLPAALLAGMAALSGPSHGDAARLASTAISTALAGRTETFLTERADQDPYAFGFGHPLYPAGDPRGAHLLRHLPKEAPAVRAVRDLSKRLARPPNVDAGLAAVSHHLGWPPQAGATLFGIGRTAGWIAHAREQVRSGIPIRPRATYRSEAESHA